MPPIRWLAVAALVTACSKPPSRMDPEPQRLQHREPRPVEREHSVAPPRTAIDASDGVVEFRALAEAVAARSSCRVIAWGTAPLADDGEPRRFAVLEPEEPGQGRGAYLIEDSPAARWLVSYAVDGRTLPWAVEPGESHGGDLRWQVRDDGAVEHAQAHRHGGEELGLALRDGELVVLTHDYTGDADTEVTERQRFARDGVCQGPCPRLRDFPTADLDLQVIGPAATLTALVGAGVS